MEKKIKRTQKHGLSKTRIYHLLCIIKQRCTNKMAENFFRYGGRGIYVCKEWDDPKAFYDWAISSGYKKGLTIDRIDNDGPYSPANCRWATKKEQANNRSNNMKIMYKGELVTLSAASELTGINLKTLHSRIHLYKWPIERVLDPLNYGWNKFSDPDRTSFIPNKQ